MPNQKSEIRNQKSLLLVLIITATALAADTPGPTAPAPPVIDPGAPGTATSPGKAPSDAIVLFDGTDLSQWEGGKWKVENGYMQVNGGNLVSKLKYADAQLHIEWATPAEVKGSSQGRGNSGCYLQGRYEIQVLDSFNNKTYYDGQAGAIYGQKPPDVNASRGPGQWQTYDIVYHAPRFDADGKLAQPATVTVLHNGVLIQDHIAIKASPQTGPKNSTQTGPLLLQDHGNPVRYRNVWIRPLNEGK